MNKGLTTRSFLIAIIFLFLGVLWVRQSELVFQSCQVTESSPPVPAIATILFLAALHPLLTRLGRAISLSRPEMLTIYCFVSIGVIMSSVGVVRLLFPSLVVPFYFETAENNFATLQKFIPKWFVPHDKEALRLLYEGSETALVPWGLWFKPLALWLLFYLALWTIMLCLTAILRKQWVEKERLAFPLLYIPLNITEISTGATGERPFFKNSIMWVGFSIAAVYNATNIFNAFNPSVASLGLYFDFGSLFTEKPLIGLRPLVMYHRPELIGLGYLVSLEVLFSVWFFYLIQRFISMFALMMGYEQAGFPFEQEQGSGVYIAIALFLLWVARGQIKDVLKKAFLNSKEIDDKEEPIPYRWAVIGIILGLAYLLFWSWRAGLALWVAALYFSLVLSFMLVYSRIRAETGTPATWLFPYYQAKRMPINAFGSQFFMINNSLQTHTIWSSIFFLARGFFISTTAYQMEFFKLSDEMKMPRKQMAFVCLLALIIGLIFAFWMHLSTYYKYGANVLEGGTTASGYRTYLAITEYTETANYLKTPKLPDVPRTIAAGVGFFVTLTLIICRTIFLRFPLNPLGYAMAMSIGVHLWGAFFIVWIIKLVVLRMGGIKLYRRLMPGFIGLAIGHFFTAGIIWGWLGIFMGESAKRYVIWFA